MSDNEPPIGTPIYDDVRRAEEGKSPEAIQHEEGEHVVVTPFTAGSAGTAHTEES